MDAESSCSIFWVMLAGFWVGKDMSPQCVDQGVPSSFAVLPHGSAEVQWTLWGFMF